MEAAVLHHVVPDVAESVRPPATVLIVDDERGPRLALQLIMQRRFRVLTAETGEQALELLKTEPVDVVTLDLKMPGLGGQNTLSLAREIDSGIPVIIITGYGSFESAVSALKLRAFDYVAKPFDSKKILALVESAAREHRQSRAERLLGPLEEVLEAADRLEESAAYWLSNPDRDALDRIRFNVRFVREQVRPKLPGDENFDLFTSRKEHG